MEPRAGSPPGPGAGEAGNSLELEPRAPRGAWPLPSLRIPAWPRCTREISRVEGLRQRPRWSGCRSSPGARVLVEPRPGSPPVPGPMQPGTLSSCGPLGTGCFPFHALHSNHKGVRETEGNPKLLTQISMRDALLVNPMDTKLQGIDNAPAQWKRPGPSRLEPRPGGAGRARLYFFIVGREWGEEASLKSVPFGDWLLGRDLNPQPSG